MIVKSDLHDALRTLPASGDRSFEGLIADLLSNLTGRRFFIARPGRQAGHDAVSDATGGSQASIECKRYLQDTRLDERELLGELVQACQTIPDLDLWVLVASRDVHAQLLNMLITEGHSKGIEILAISAGDDVPSSLEVLCAAGTEIVLDYLDVKDNEARRTTLEKQLQAISSASGFADTLSRLRSEFSPAHIGYDHWRIVQNQFLGDCCRSDAGSRAAFGQPLDVEGDKVRLIERKRAWEQLDTWLKDWGQTRAFFVLTGEEGDGKTWAAASWLTKKIRISEQWPPVIFVASSRATSSDPDELLRGAIRDTTRLHDKEYWGKRLNRWMERPQGDIPVFVLVLDGINERHSFDWWRDLLQNLATVRWNRVAVIVTCRSSYWQQYFANLSSLPVYRYDLAPYDDEELAEAMKIHGLHMADLPSTILLRLRTPRFLDLVVRHRQRMAESGDITSARLVYEDWRDRYTRKTQTPLSDEEFQTLIREIAHRHLTGATSISQKDLSDMVPFAEDQKAVLRELTTGGVLRLEKGRLKAEERLLHHGFGLLLADQVEVACRTRESDPIETVARWLEPHSDLDLQAAICGAAVLHALQVPDYPLAGRVALLNAWVSSQNPTQDTEQAFPAYLPLCPRCYIQLAESVWREAAENRWAQELIMRALLRWRKSPQVSAELVTAFERWLGFVHPCGYPAQRGPEGKNTDKVHAEIADRLGQNANDGTVSLAGHSMILAEDDGLLRLGRAVLAIISHESRGRYVHAMAGGCLAEAVMGFPDKYELFAWVMRTSPESIWTEIEQEVSSLIAQGSLPALQAARRLLSYEGSAAAASLAETLPKGLFPRHPLDELYGRDPCASGFTWRRKDRARCAQRTDLEPQWLARQLKPCCIDPDLEVPPDLGERLAPLAERIPVESLWIGLVMTSEQHLLEEIEPALSAYAPEAVAGLIQRVAQQIGARQGLPLRQVAIYLRDYAPLLTPNEVEALSATWQQLVAKSGAWTDEELLTESFFFTTLLHHMSPQEQLARLLGRPQNAHDLLQFECIFRPVADWNELLSAIEGASDATTLRRLLWFAACSAQHAPAYFAVSLCRFLTHADSFMRSLVLRVLYGAKQAEATTQIIRSLWAWDSGHHPEENHWGSLILCEQGQELSWAELRCRVHPNWLGYALERRGAQPAEIRQYGKDLHHVWERLCSDVPEIPPDFPSVELDSSDIHDASEVTRLSLSQSQFTRSVTFVGRTAYWGGRLSGDNSQLEQFNSPDYGDRQRTLMATMEKVIEEQRQAGNELFARYFRANGLAEVISDCPDEIHDMVAAALADTPQADKLVWRARSLYEGLCSRLLVHQPGLGVQLHRKLESTARGIRYQKAGTRITWTDYGLFAATPLPAVEDEWERRLAECTSDRALLEVVLAAQAGTAMEWLRLRIMHDLQPQPQWKCARALMLLAFLDDAQAETQLCDFIAANASPWLADIADDCLHLWKRNNWAKHWFRLFLKEQTETKAWAAFRLFLECVDSRFYHWVDAVLKDTANLDGTHPRMSYLRQQWSEIEKSAERNEKELVKTYLTEKILDNSAWPWMGMVGDH